MPESKILKFRLADPAFLTEIAHFCSKTSTGDFIAVSLGHSNI
jgi:hypothetical protein